MSFKEELESRTLEMLDQLQSTGEGAINFLEGEVPLFLNEVVTYYLIWNSVEAVICALLVAACIWAIHWGYAKAPREYGEPGMIGTFAAIFSFIFGVVFLVGAVESASVAVKAGLAPRVFLVEYLSKLVSS